MILEGPEAKPLKKGDIVIVKRTCVDMNGWMEVYHSAHRLVCGGENPVGENGERINPDDVQKVIRPRAELASGYPDALSSYECPICGENRAHMFMRWRGVVLCQVCRCKAKKAY